MPMVFDQVRRRSRTAMRKAGLAPSGPVYGRLVDAGRALPISPKARVAVSTAMLRRPWHISVPFDRLLVGAQGGWTAREFAERTDDLMWTSTRLLDGPHVGLLRMADARRESGGEHAELTDGEILASDYGRMARRCIAAGGRYFGATDDPGVIAAGRDFIARYRGAGETGTRRPEQSGRLDPVLVAPVRGSGYYQVLDGHHRLAIAVMRGAGHARVIAKWLPVTTLLQDLLVRMSWLDGTHELYQPVAAPELEKGWTTVRRCTDRLDKMTGFLAERGIGSPSSYLDVASCYGWFVSRMGEAGFEAHGMELDPLAVPLGQAAYGLPAGAISVGDAVELLKSRERTYDVVSCFSLLHHFVLGRGAVSAEDLLKLLDEATGRVLFLDTGQENEGWFQTSLKGWNPATIKDFLERNGTFDEVVDLGPDEDAQPPYEDHYRRHLFACVRA